jgi:hypothetical protein
MTMPRLSRARVIKLQRLLNMRYKPQEIADELGVTVETVYRSYIPAGAPCERDAQRHMWIPGAAFARWAREYLAQKDNRPRKQMQEGQGYCLRCNQVVDLGGIKQRAHKRGVMQVSGVCPNCSGKVNRFKGGSDGKP